MAEEFTSIALPGAIRVQVTVGYGTVTITQRDGPAEATVRLTPRSGPPDLLDHYDVSLRGATLVVAAAGAQGGVGLTELLGGWRHRRGAVDVAVEVPTGTPVTVVSAADQLTLTGRCGAVEVTTGGGRISVEAVDGDLQLRYGNGDCHVGSVTGTVRLKGGNGPAQLDEVGGALDAQLGRGDLRLGAAHGPLRIRTGYGDVHVGTLFADADLATGVGAITIGVPAGVAAHVEASTGLGRVSSQLPVEEEPAAGAGRVAIRARTGVGDVTVLRAAGVAVGEPSAG